MIVNIAWIRVDFKCLEKLITNNETLFSHTERFINHKHEIRKWDEWMQKMTCKMTLDIAQFFTSESVCYK